MLDTIILLTNPAEQPALAGRLAELVPHIRIIRAGTRAELLAIPLAAFAHARLIAFATPVIVPPAVLDALGYGAYNFHPGPPDYPGLCPAQYAVYDGARRFGVTAHRMVERVDAGPIVATIMFEVAAPSSVDDLEVASYRELARLFWELSPHLVTLEEALPEMPVSWGARKSSRRTLEALCDIPPGIEPGELDRRIAAFGNAPFGVAPSLRLHGHIFRLVEEAQPEVQPAVPKAAA